ncbi:MAG TPA: recombination mediator RecR [Chlamydiales bacterium]|nr:recombination mediator RecR [Chlamydiales bacterium]
MQSFPEDLRSLIAYFKKLPGVGARTAERFAFELLSWTKEDLDSFSKTVTETVLRLPPCPSCGCLSNRGICLFCQNEARDVDQICLISSPRDAFAIETTRCYRGLYHVIEHLLSPLDGRHASMLKIERIEERISKHKIQEVIIAFDSTIEGDTTALYLKTHLSTRAGLKVSRLAFGLPVGSSLEHIDEGTLTRALAGRQIF